MHLEEELKRHFGYDSFREGQKEIIVEILKGNHVIGRLPTGSGKSLCYFFLSRYIKGIFLVISPLVALMEDQVYRLKMEGFKQVVALNGLRTAEEKKEIISSLPCIKYLFLSPEMLQNAYICDRLRQIEIGLFVVDEAHCISKWGYDFRSDYLRLREFLSKNQPVRVMALTATATPAVLLDIQAQLGISDASVILSKMNRSNISILVEGLPGTARKYQRLFELVKGLAKPMIIYCNRRKATEELYQYLRHIDGLEWTQIAYFHGGIDAQAKMSLTAQFVAGNIDVMICTNAFGMGLHKADIRTVLHFDPPLQMDSYMQEMGRAGRDGQPACSIVLWTDEDFYHNQCLLLNERIEKSQIETYLYLRYVQKNGDNISVHKSIEYYLDVICDSLADGCTLEKKANFIEKNIDFCVEKIYKDIVQRKQFHIEECKYMEQFFREEKQCRRERLLAYFGEQVTEEHTCCCDVCGDRVSNYELVATPRKERVQEENWLWKLQRLLLDGANGCAD